MIKIIKNSSKTIEQRRLSQSRTKLQQIITAISLVAVFLYTIVFTDLSVHLFETKNPIRHHHIYLQNRSLVAISLQSTTSIRKQFLSEKEVVEEDPLVPPLNLTPEERIIWFKKKLPEFEILKSTVLTRQFKKRVQEFLKGGCKVQLFMIWISPARSFGDREFLAMECLFKTNPDSCLIILSRTMDSAKGFTILKPLIDKGFKVQAITPDLSFLFKNSPAETWFKQIKKGNTDPGEIPLAQNLSNLIRLAILYKYGGVYIDSDFIVLKDFSSLRNSIGAQSSNLSGKWTRLNNAVLIFDKNHPILYSFIEEFASTFNGNRWGFNGPYLVSRVVERESIGYGYSSLNLTVLPPMALYPVDWRRIEGLFLPPANLKHKKWIEAKLLQLGGATYGVHLWNKQSRTMKIEEGSVMSRLLSTHCVICDRKYSS